MAVITSGVNADATWTNTVDLPSGTTTAGVGGNVRGWTLNVPGLAHTATLLGNTSAVFAQGLRQWSGTIDVILGTARPGTSGQVEYSNGYAANVQSWTITAGAPVVDVTKFENTGDAPNYWTTFESTNLLQWSGSYQAMIDDTTLLESPGNTDDITTPTEPSAAAFYLRRVDGVNDDDLTGSIIPTALGLSVTPDGLPVASYSFNGSGALTVDHAVTGGANHFLASGALSIAAASTLTLTSTTTSTPDRTYAGSAILESLTITVNPNELISASLAFRGSSTLTIA